MAFDLENFAATSERVQWEDLDFDAFDAQPLDDPTLRVLRYMCDVEYHTSCYLRDLLVTRSHRKDEARGFMTTWNREEFWHGEALAAVLGRHGITVGYDELKARQFVIYPGKLTQAESPLTFQYTYSWDFVGGSRQRPRQATETVWVRANVLGDAPLTVTWHR